MRKQGEKPEDSINEKLPKLDKETKKKTDDLLLAYLLVMKNLQNLTKKTGKKT